MPSKPFPQYLLSSLSFLLFLKQLYPLGTNTSQFQPREFYHHTLPAPPPPNHPPPPVPEPIYACPGSIYGTLPRGPPRPVKRPNLPLFDLEQPLHEESITDADLKSSLTGSLINYATFRQNISNEAAIAAQKRAMINAKIARHWSNDDLANLQRLSKSEGESLDEGGNEADDSSEVSDESQERLDDDDDANDSNEVRRQASPSPPPTRSRARSRSSSPGKTVTFLDDQDERSLNELVSSPRRVINLKLPLTKTLAEASTIFGGQKRKKRLAPSPPTSKSDKEIELVDEDEEEDEDVLEHTSTKGHHEALGAKLSASLRATFARNSQS